MSEREKEVNMVDRLQEMERRLEMAEAENRRKDEELRRSSQMLHGGGRSGDPILPQSSG